MIAYLTIAVTHVKDSQAVGNGRRVGPNFPSCFGKVNQQFTLEHDRLTL